ncbi:TLD domain containing protein [Nitzschia inconspicua]|uniref:Oxidation resistance protein 1 n=1 Tax=Nitzschia inconspicua TaxID=303405 RepID=A0A9K3LUT8_9STRA|nr:TLD domain containing protein [Nitzschia inconspicua]
MTAIDDGSAAAVTSFDAPPGLTEMFINSTDSLRHRSINQKIPPSWNDHPPLFVINVPSRTRPYLWRKPQEDLVTEKEDPNLLKGMIRKGIPPPLRCAVWLSNTLQSSHPDQSLDVSHEFRTLAKVRVVDGLYDSLWHDKNNNNTHQQESANGIPRTIHRQDVKRMDFGNTAVWTRLDEEQCVGREALERVLYALHHCVVGGIADYAPLLPSLAVVLLGFMSESYVFYSCREMFLHSTWYFATSRAEYVATRRAFLDVLERLHPQTIAVMEEQEATEQFTEAIFQDFFATILPEWMVSRLMDMYSLEGSKVLFRFGVALAVLYGKEYKEHYMYASTERNKYWLGLMDYCHSGEDGNGLNFEVLVKKAYGVHGRGVRKRFRFPRRPILARIIEMEEEAYRKQQMNLAHSTGGSSEEATHHDADATTDFYLHHIEPLGLVIPLPPADPFHERIIPKFAESTFVRTKLAEWLPLSLRFTKLDLVFSTSHHGRTLEALYRHVATARHTILILEPYHDSSNKDNILIGMYASQPWHPSTRVYGDGRCFLFRIVLDDEEVGKEGMSEEQEKEQKQNDRPVSQCWKWHPPELLEFGSAASDDQESHHKSYAEQAALETFQISTNDFLSMGGNEHGGSGLRLNEDLTKAESSTAAGFDNEPLLPGGGGMFEVGLVEIYQLVRQMDGVPVK